MSVIWEIENHGTKKCACFEAINVEEIHRVVLLKGYTCLLKHKLYAGIDEKGNEISIMPATLEHVTAIKPIPGEKRD